MILLLGGTGFVGQEFQRYLQAQGIAYRNVCRSECDYTDKGQLNMLIQELKPEFLINCAGYTGKPNVDACELQRADCLAGNAVLPGTIREVCEDAGLTWGHVSSGCIYTGRRKDGAGFTEEDEPNFSFRNNNCSFYSGTKALGEEVLEGAENCYVWRLRIPFNHKDSPRNYISKLMRYDCILEAENSISHLDEFVSACWQTIEKRVPVGIYNMTNSGSVLSSEVAEMAKTILKLDRDFEYFANETDFMAKAAKTPRSNCVIDNSKLLATGIKIPEVHEALERSLNGWIWEE
ncbi:sugar nucleotide-binding protein [Akkermansiaceae bacterium]|jgi:UDP-glucose 4,6-dehydratase|nr:sugar nucleotide-binding protein [Akkermansiaceae bacterium]